MATREYSNEAITVFWDADRCVHSGNCLRGLPGVFDLDARPWINVAAADADQLAAQIQKCPSGALHFRREDGGTPEPVATETVITPVHNGPLYVQGYVEVRDRAGAIIRKDTRMALCRCGSSENTPFCDNACRQVGFRAE